MEYQIPIDGRVIVIRFSYDESKLTDRLFTPALRLISNIRDLDELVDPVKA